MNRATFFSFVRHSLFDGKLSQPQVNGLTAILDRFYADGHTDMRWLAYMLATAYHETGATMEAITENLNYSATGLRAIFPEYFNVAASKLYARKPEKIANRAYANRMGNRSEESGDGWLFRGRGLVQITGRNNYRTFGIDKNPDQALELGTAVAILVTGMVTGVFTGKRLAHYFSAAQTDWLNARRIINGLDRAADIARYATQFHAALEVASL